MKKMEKVPRERQLKVIILCKCVLDAVTLFLFTIFKRKETR